MGRSARVEKDKEPDDVANETINDDNASKSTASNSSSLDSPRSILRSNKNLLRYSNFVSRTHLRRNVSFSRRNQVFLIPNRKMLKEEQRRAMRRRRLKRRLVMRRGGYNIVTRRRRQSANRRAIDGQIRRPNRLARARRKYYSVKRRVEEDGNRNNVPDETRDEVMESEPTERNTTRSPSPERAIRRRRSEIRRKRKTRSQPSRDDDRQ